MNAGTYYAKATVAADAKHDAATSKAAKLVIKKKAQTFCSVTSTKTLRYSALKKSKQSFTISATVQERAKTSYALSFVPSAAQKYVSVSSAGKVTVKKGLAKGSYAIKVRITAGETTNYAKTTVTRTIKLVVK